MLHRHAPEVHEGRRGEARQRRGHHPRVEPDLVLGDGTNYFGGRKEHGTTNIFLRIELLLDSVKFRRKCWIPRNFDEGKHFQENTEKDTEEVNGR